MPTKKISDAALEALKALPWTGNIRELRNMVERLIILSDKTITDTMLRHLPTHRHPAATAAANAAPQTDFDQFTNFQEYKDFAEREYINLSSKKTTGTYQKLPMILIYNAVTFTARLRSLA
jgi:two-component system nitrogen regulation response regulator NtrX